MGSISITLSNLPDIGRDMFAYELESEKCLYDILRDWCEKSAPGFEKRLFDPVTGGIGATMLVLQNGRSVKSEDPRETMISPGDALSILPILIGG